MDEARRALARVDANTGFARVALDQGVRAWGEDAYWVRHPCGMSLVWGDRVDRAFDDVIAHLRAAPEVQWLQIDPRWRHLDWTGALAGRVEPHTRVEFALDCPLPAPTPREAGWRLHPASAEDFRLPGTVVPADYWPDPDAFLAAGGGIVAERDGQVGAIAFTAYRWDDRAEIGIETVPGHRRIGLARLVAAAMVRRVLDDRLVPVWSCREGNTGSMRLAEAVGFVVAGRGPYLQIGPIG